MCRMGPKPGERSVFSTGLSLILVLCLSCFCPAESPYEKAGGFEANNEVDRLFLKRLETAGLKPAGICSDEVFIRRVYLDITGTLPEGPQVRKFLENPRPDKRATLVNSLLQSDLFAEYWSLKWCDVLRVKSEFPINLWPNAVQAYHRWVYDALRQNMPYDRFARELLTSSGSNFRVPPVNFYRAVQGNEPAALAEAVALTFMGSRFEKWPLERRQQMAAFFSRLAFKETAEWKEQIVYLNPAEADVLTGVFPDGTKTKIQPEQDPRHVFADWLVRADNAWFARNAVNRTWYWLLGRGLIHEPDDIRPDNPPAHPDILAHLEKELVDSGWDLKHIYKLILNSSVYQQSPVSKEDPAKAEKFFACYPVRQMDAEVLIDALCRLTGSTEEYSSPVPEPFTFVPDQNRSIELADGSITSQFLEMYGRPARDTGLLSERNSEPSAAQRRDMLNSSHIKNKLERSARLNGWIKSSRNNSTRLIQSVYLDVLSRYATDTELKAIEEYRKKSKLNARQSVTDLTWALINSKEFLYRH